MTLASPSDNCVRFESPLVVETKFYEGEAFTEEGVTMTVAAFPGIAAPLDNELCYARIAWRPRGIPFWEGNHLELFCVTLVFDFGSAVSNVQFKYNEIDIDSSEPPVLVIEINTLSRGFSSAAELDGVVLDGVTIAVDLDANNPGYGNLVLDGRIDSLTVGSVNRLCIDDVCFSRS